MVGGLMLVPEAGAVRGGRRWWWAVAGPAQRARQAHAPQHGMQHTRGFPALASGCQLHEATLPCTLSLAGWLQCCLC